MVWALLLALACGEKAAPLGGMAAGDSGSSVGDSGQVETDTGAGAGDSGEPGPACDPFEPSGVTSEVVLSSADWAVDDARTDANPLKGFITSYLWAEPSNDFPDTMEFLYLPMSDLWGADGETFDASLEPLMTAAAERSHHVVLRVYLDYPSKPSGVPSYLSDVVECVPYTEHGGGCSPDYENPELREAILGLIAALGHRYDGDPRLGFVQIGLLGFWGEWHTWPHAEMFPSESMQADVLNAFTDAFTVTHLQARRPAVHAADLRIGFHDDSFAYSTLGDIDWFFWPIMVAAGADERWQEVPIGGELRPELQTEVFDETYSLSTYAQDFNECVATTHATYMLNYWAFNGDGVGYAGAERARAEEAARGMGYTFALDSAALRLADLDGGRINGTVSVEIAATGAAPFYYPLTPVLADQATGEVIATSDPLLSLLPGDSQTVEFTMVGVSPVTFAGPLVLEFTSPMLLPGQRIQLPTVTPWTESEGPTAVAWSLGCEVSTGRLSIGERVSVDGQVCECRCDVDGRLRNPSGAVCL